MKQLFFKAPKPTVRSEKPLPSLAACVVMDLIGMASFGIPILGEVLDLAWAPISAAVFYRMFGRRMGVFGGAFAFLEELLPGTDIIPTFTIAWLLQYAAQRKQKVTYYPVR